jgi:hypothetical protein
MYHFGFPEDSDQLIRYVYRSTDSFEPERHEEPGFAIKPGPEGEFEPPNDVDEWVALAERIRAEQDARPAGERIYIGGELYLGTAPGTVDTSSLMSQAARARVWSA